MSRRQQIRGGATALPLSLISQAIPMLSRHELAALTERLIDRLDILDGNCDLEDDDPLEEDDHSGTDLDFGEYDEAALLPPPTYGIDQRIIECCHPSGFTSRLNAEGFAFR